MTGSKVLSIQTTAEKYGMIDSIVSKWTLVHLDMGCLVAFHPGTSRMGCIYVKLTLKL